MTKLYVVIQSPKLEWRRSLVAAVWFTQAPSKARALHYFRELCPEAATNTGEDRYYLKPTAHLVHQGGNALRV